MPRFSQIAFAVALLWVGTTAALAADVIDQNASTNNVLMSTFSAPIFQSFQQSAANISGAGIFLDPYQGYSGEVRISLWNKLPEEVGATELTSASGIGTSGSWFDVFWSPVSIVPDTTYYLGLSASTPLLAISGDLSNGYSRGSIYAGSLLIHYPNEDYTFRTYASVSAVPEPETYAMLLAGLGMLGFVGKRRKAH